MRVGTHIWIAALLAVGSASLAATAVAQPRGLSDRDCQVIRTCNFARTGAYRGCLSSYSCRRCKFVPSRCTVDGSQRVCQRLRCTWG
jgi:hypothetical protein